MSEVQGYLAHKKPPPPPRTAIGLLEGPRRRRLLMSEVPLYPCTRTHSALSHSFWAHVLCEPGLCYAGKNCTLRKSSLSTGESSVKTASAVAVGTRRATIGWSARSGAFSRFHTRTFRVERGGAVSDPAPLLCSSRCLMGAGDASEMRSSVVGRGPVRGGAPASTAEEGASMPRDIHEASGDAGAPKPGAEGGRREEASGEVGRLLPVSPGLCLSAPPGTEQERREENLSEGGALEENWTRFSESLRRSGGGVADEEKELQVTERSNLGVARSYLGDALPACAEARDGWFALRSWSAGPPLVEARKTAARAVSTALLARSSLERAASLKRSSLGDALPACSEARGGWRVGPAEALRLVVDEADTDAEASNEEFGAAWRGGACCRRPLSRGGAFKSASALFAMVLDPSSTTVETKAVALSSQLPLSLGRGGAVGERRAMGAVVVLCPASSTAHCFSTRAQREVFWLENLEWLFVSKVVL